MNLLIKNARLVDASETVEISVADGVITRIGAPVARAGDDAAGVEVIDAGGHLVTSPFIDPHLHLDAVLTAGKPRYNLGGTHPEGIEVWGEYKEAYPGFEDLEQRVRRAVEWEVSQGTLSIRTHVDVCDPDLTALKKLLNLRETLRDIVDIQIVAFPQDGIFADPHGAELMEEAMVLGADLVGGIPHGELTREDGCGVRRLRIRSGGEV